MQILLYSGLLYLVGISIILILKPTLMFAKNGVWKEFGIGRNSERYTWMPFWLFAILWAIVSYIVILVLVYKPATPVSMASLPNLVNEAAQTTLPESKGKMLQAPSATMTSELPMQDTPSVQMMEETPKRRNMRPGYYVLDAEATAKRGIPKYIYLGPEAPNLVYNEGMLE
jgi:hypothetical protein